MTPPTGTGARPGLDRRAARRQETKDEIVAAAWALVREQGLAGLNMRDLGARVGMKAQSLYSYFSSKTDIYDAMFHEGYEAFLAAMGQVLAESEPPEAAARAHAHAFFAFCTADPARYQLLFQRTIPDFEPSEASYAVALEAYALMVANLADLGVQDPAATDLWTAVLTGLTDQQLSNDPGGDRWGRLVDRAVDMLIEETVPTRRRPAKGGS